MHSLVDGAGVSASRIVAEARTWLGTPFVHQASKRGVGTDCAGLVRGVLHGLSLVPDDYERRFPDNVFAYHRRADGVTLKRICDEQLEITAGPEVGGVALIRFGKRPHHLGFFGDYFLGGFSLIHALGPDFPTKVVEQRFDGVWTSRLVASYRIPGAVA